MTSSSHPANLNLLHSPTKRILLFLTLLMQDCYLSTGCSCCCFVPVLWRLVHILRFFLHFAFSKANDNRTVVSTPSIPSKTGWTFVTTDSSGCRVRESENEVYPPRRLADAPLVQTLYIHEQLLSHQLAIAVSSPRRRHNKSFLLPGLNDNS